MIRLRLGRILTHYAKNNLYEENVHWLLDIDDTLIECKSYVGSTQVSKLSMFFDTN